MKVSGQAGLLFIGFNQDHSCFAVGTENGFQIWNCDPLKERFRRDLDGGIGIVEMLFRCNILALVGGGKNPKYPTNKVMIWDDFQNKCLAELEFSNEVKGVRLRRDRIVVALENKVYIYNFADLEPIHHIETAPNPKGLVGLSPASDNTVLACLGSKPGYVYLMLNDMDKQAPIKAHENAVGQMTLNRTGTRLATASELGTVIRVWDTATGELVAKLRRGKDRADITSLSFSADSKWLCVSSDKGTIHVFGLAEGIGEDHSEEKKTQKSRLSFMTGFLPGGLNDYVDSDFSYAQIHLAVPQSVCTFGDNHSVIVVGGDGFFYKYTLDVEHGGEAIKDKQEMFFSVGDIMEEEI